MVVVRKIFVSLAVFMMLLASPASSVSAQSFDQSFLKAMPEYELLPEAEFIDQTILHSDEPADYKNLKYQIRYPKDWVVKGPDKQDDFDLTSNVFTDIFEAVSPGRLTTERSTLSVKVLKLGFKLTAEQWVTQDLLSSGSPVEGFEAHSENRVETLQVNVVRGDTFIVRSLASVNGDDLVLVQYSMPIDVWEDEKIQQAQVIDSFELLNMDEGVSVEDMQSFDFLDVASLYYPSFWDLVSSPFRTVDLMRASLINVPVQFKGALAQNAPLDGKIDIKLVLATMSESLEAEIKTYENELAEMGVVFGEEVDHGGFVKFDETFEFGRVRAYNIASDNQKLKDYEVWTALMSAENYFYFLTLLTPSRSSDYLNWSRNTQAFRLVLKLMHPKTDLFSSSEDDRSGE